jgi:hypothetical protein
MKRILTTALRVASVPVGIGVGVWTALLTTTPIQETCPPGALCFLMKIYFLPRPVFAIWECVLFGAGAAAVLLVLSFAVARLPVARPPVARPLDAA